MENDTKDTVIKSEAEWREALTPEQYRVLRQAGTERAFTGKYWDAREDGTYVCAGCGQELFTSDTKFDSHCGWPSFYAAMDPNKVEMREDRSLGMRRVEVLCQVADRNARAHLAEYLDLAFDPSTLAWDLRADGTWERTGDEGRDLQELLMKRLADRGE